MSEQHDSYLPIEILQSPITREGFRKLYGIPTPEMIEAREMMGGRHIFISHPDGSGKCWKDSCKSAFWDDSTHFQTIKTFKGARVTVTYRRRGEVG